MAHTKLNFTIPWYEKEDWELIKKISEDSDEMENTFEEWYSKALSTKMFFEKEGFNVIQTLIKPDEILQWSKAKNCKIHASSRERYISEKQKEIIK